jgi:hypothetical protein
MNYILLKLLFLKSYKNSKGDRLPKKMFVRYAKQLADQKKLQYRFNTDEDQGFWL